MHLQQDKLDMVVTIYKKNGFSSSEIKKALLTKKYPFDKIPKFEENYENYHKKMIDLGYTEEEIRTLAIYYPNAIYHKFDHGKLRKQYVEFLKRFNNQEKTDDNFDFKCSEIKKILKNLNVSKKRIDIAFKTNSKIIFMEPQVLLDNIDFYLKCGMTKKQLRKCANTNFSFLEYGKEDYKDLLKELEFFSIDKLGFIKIVMTYVKNQTAVHIDELLEMLKAAKTKKLDYQIFGKNLVKNLTVRDYTSEKFEKAYQNLLELDFTEIQTCRIISRAVSVLSMTKESIEYKISILSHYNVDKEESLNIVSIWPTYFTLSPENIISKLDVALRYGILWYLLSKPSNFIQSCDLTEEHATYLQMYYPDLDEEIFAKSVYRDTATFDKKYKNLVKNKM